MSEINDWTRFWCPLDDTYYIDQYGYLMDPTLGPFSANSHLITNPFDEPERCVILLGEPGIGKTTAMNNYEPIDNNVHSINLDHIGTPMQFVTEVFEDPKFQEWTKGDYEFLLLLDSFDECVLRNDTISKLLINHLRKCPIDRLSLRIACRTGDWPDTLKSDLINLLGENDYKEYILTNLRKKDVELSANNQVLQEAGKNADDFIDKLEMLEVVPFAVHPVTLKLLINLYNKESSLPETKSEIFRKGCLTLCKEFAPSRRDSSISGNYTPEQRYITAARIAAYCVFSRKSGIWVGLDLEDIPEDFIPELEIRGGHELIGEDELHISRELVNATLSCGLFTSTKPKREWLHRTFMEFLAADYIIHKKIQLNQIYSLIRNPYDPDYRTQPHLRGTIAWICSHNQDLFEEIVMQEPEILLQSDAGLFTDNQKQRIIEMILIKYDESPLKTRFFDYSHLLKKFKHERIGSQVSQFMDDPSNSFDSKRFALRIAEECELLSLSSQIIDLILNKNENIHLRVAAARVIESFYYMNQVDERDQLVPIALSDEHLEDEYDLKGVCLHIVWSDLISFSDLFEHLPEPNLGYVGAYSRFLLGKFIDELQQTDIVHALRWIREKALINQRISTFNRVVEKILIKSLNFLNISDIFESLIQTMGALILDDRYINEFSYDSELHSKLEIESEIRHKLLRGVLQILPNDSITLVKLSMNIVSYIQSQPRLFELIYMSDFEWMLQELEHSEEGEYREKLIDLIMRMLRNRSDRMEKGLELYINNEILKPILESWFVIHLDSKLAADMKRDYEKDLELQSRLDELSKDRPQPQIEPPLEERIKLLLVAYDQGNVDVFSRLSRELTLTANSVRYGNTFNPNLKKLPGWNNSQPEIQSRIITVAKDFIVQGKPHTDTWFGTDTFSNNALAGYQAIRLIYEIDVGFIHNLTDQIWKKWIPIIVLFPINWSENGQEREIQRELIKIAYPYAKENLFLVLSSEVDKEDRNNSRLYYILDKIDNLADIELLNFLHNKSQEENLSNQSKGDLFTFLLKKNHSQTITSLNTILSENLATDSNFRDLTIEVAEALILHSPENHWDVIWPLIQNDEEWSKVVLEEVANNDRFSKDVYSKYSEMQLADLYIWLVAEYPAETDIPLSTGVRFVTREDHVREWRDNIKRYLESKGNFEAVDAIKYIIENLPEKAEDLSYSLIAAVENARNMSLEPPNLKELRVLFENPASRLIQSGTQLLNLICESLSRLEEKIQGRDPYSPAARFLWDKINKTEYKPVGEEDFSDYVKNHLYDDISQDVVINRNVEISRIAESDLLITIFNPRAILPQNRMITTIIEVKGKWHIKLGTAMEEQLLNKYLIPRRVNYGIYLVGWFDSEFWVNDYRKSSNTNIETIEGLREILGEQARKLSQGGIVIKPIAIDVSLNEVS